jgi:hypothetical protein
MLKLFTAFLFVWIAISCHQQAENKRPECPGNSLFYEGTITDTERITLTDLSFKSIVSELSLESCLPDSERLYGKPESYIAEIAEVPNWSKTDYDRMIKETNGQFHLDTTDRDFEKFWYDKKGLLYRYETRSFSDMRHNEVCLSFYPNNMIEWMYVNYVVTDRLKYKYKTVQFSPDGRVIVMNHNVVPDTSHQK